MSSISSIEVEIAFDFCELNSFHSGERGEEKEVKRGQEEKRGKGKKDRDQNDMGIGKCEFCPR